MYNTKKKIPPPGNPLLFSTRKYDEEGWCGIYIHPEKVFTEKQLKYYYLNSHTIFSHYIQIF